MRDKFNGGDGEVPQEGSLNDVLSGRHDPENDDDTYEGGRRRSVRPEWEQTTATRDEEGTGKDEEFIISPEPLAPGGPQDDGTGPDATENGPEEESFDPVSNVIKLYTKPGQPPSPEALVKVLTQAMEQGWETLYVYKGDGKTPDYQMGQIIQSFIEQNNLGDRICCCLDPEEYKQCGTAADICDHAVENGAVRKKDLSFS